MMRTKRTFLLLMALILVLPSFLVQSTSAESSNREEVPQQPGEFSSKDEVVYATLSPTGDQQEIYVVNIFDVVKAGKVDDYGPYTSLKNLTDLSEIVQKDEKVQFTAPKGKFYYQGNMKNEPLPWDISISYKLNGKRVTPDELLGQNGHVELSIATSANEEIDPTFFENYLLQVAITLDPEKFENIGAPDAMVANAGKNKQITFTVMPEKEGDLSVEADVKDFELAGMEISAVPSSMSIDAPDIGEMTGEMESLSDAIGDIHNGVGQLKQGISQLNQGVAALRDGSAQYQNGMSEINKASSELVAASGQINDGIATINNGLHDNMNQLDLGDFEDLPISLADLAEGLNATLDGLALLRENYSSAFNNLDAAIKAIPDYEISQAQIEELSKNLSEEDRAVLGQLMETYANAAKAKETYNSVKASFAAVDARLKELDGAIAETEETLTSISNAIASFEDIDVVESISQLQSGMSEFADNYGQFHSGLVSYTNGVGQLSSSYNELHSGIEELSGGTSELENGASQLHNGTFTLYDATSNIPVEMQEEIDKLISEYDKSDFEAVSFVSPENDKINSVQFVIKTESIQKDEQDKDEAPKEEKKGFWARLKDLFF